MSPRCWRSSGLQEIENSNRAEMDTYSALQADRALLRETWNQLK